MHIQFNKIRYKNILSVGDAFIEIPLDTHNTTLIAGKNGSGKSTVIEAIVFALYNRPYRKVNKPQLVNSVNQKGLLVELEFSIASDKYLIRRGLKPAVFEIWKNGEMLNKDAAAKDYQAYLEQNIIKMSLKSFSQIVILGSATYVPFMDLPVGQRREIIEDLLDIQIFSVMNSLLKERISENKTAITTKSYDIDLIKAKLNSAKEHNIELERIKQIEVDKLRAKISENVKIVETNNDQIRTTEEQINELLSTISDKPKQKKIYDQLKELEYDLKSKHTSLIKDTGFYSDHDNCPTCKQGILDDFKDAIVAENTSKIEQLVVGMQQLDDKKRSVQSRLDVISDVEDRINQLHNTANEFRLTNKMLINQLKTIKKELQDAEDDAEAIDQSKIQHLTEHLAQIEAEQITLYEQRETLGVVASMLKDGGIKASIIKTYIPIMNKLINQYLSEFELFVDFTLDENFNEVIKSRFRDTFSFASFSEGEKMRINLSIMFTWRAVSKLRNSISTNLLFLDETLDGASDSAGVESLIDILHRLNAKDNIFVISHRGSEFQDKFHNLINFRKNGNFTEIVD